jgi:transposase
LNIECLLPITSGLVLNEIYYGEKLLTLSLSSTTLVAHCPVCQSGSQRIHSRYRRKVADLPWAEKRVLMQLTVRRFFCDLTDCKRKVFCERLHPSIAAYARRTARLEHCLQNLALQVGGEKAALLLQLLNISLVSADTLLNLSRKVTTATIATPNVVGIDEWAIRKGQTYATILVDLENRTPIDLLADAKLETVESWLKEHPGIKIISRDRDSVFAEAARKGAPDAIQVADRWHLLKNLSDALKGMLEENQPALRATAAAINNAANPDQNSITTPLQEKSFEETAPKTRMRHLQVKELQAKGWPILRIAKHLRMHRQTVKKYLRLEKVPKRRPAPNAGYKNSLSEEQRLYLANRWQAGDAKPRQIWRELKIQGYTGTASCIYRAIAHLPTRADKGVSTAKSAPTDEKAITRAQPVFSARRAMWLMVKPKKDLSEKKQELLSVLLANHSQANVAYPLVQQFITMVKNRQCQLLDGWITAAKETGIARLKQFVAGIQRDYQAVRAGLSMEWSNGQVEGQINRLKLIKRQGYGRAKLDLLKNRVLYRPTKQAA